jgi:hypothetical protein
MGEYTEAEYRECQRRAEALWCSLPGHRWKDIEAITAVLLEISRKHFAAGRRAGLGEAAGEAEEQARGLEKSVNETDVAAYDALSTLAADLRARGKGE